MTINTNSTYLLQRLNAPRENTPAGDWAVKVDRTFGEGGLGLGLSEEARKLFRHVLVFDYMGSAEFEFGAIPQSLGRIAQTKDLVAFEFVLKAADIKHGYWRERTVRDLRAQEIAKAKAAGKKPPRAKKPVFKDIVDRTFYVLCAADQREYAEQLIKNLAKGEQRLKDSSRIESILDPDPRYASHTTPQGWLNLSEDFFFFVDRTMFERVCDIFQVKIGE